MTRNMVGFVALLILLPALQSGDKPEKQTPAQQYHALVKEYQTAQQEYEKAYEKAKTQEDQQKVLQEKCPSPDKFAPRFLELAEKNPKDPAAVDALSWIVTRTDATKSDPKSPRSRAVKILLRDHVQNEKIATLCQTLVYAWDEDSQQFLRGVLEKSKDHSVQLQACLALAQQAEYRLPFARQLKDQPEMAKHYEGFMSKQAAEALVKAGPDKLSKEAEILYERIVKDFAKMPDPNYGTLGEMAKIKLEALRHPILVGRPAPEIVGEDIDGKKFKLSDYRGKVVLLVFWCNEFESCRHMYSHERSLVKRLEEKPFVLLGVNSDQNRVELKKVMKKEKITWRSFWNGGSKWGRISTRWDVNGWPTLFLIDAKGAIGYKNVGVLFDHKKFDEEIDKLVAEVEKSTAK